MLLVEMKINGVWHKLSNDFHDLPEGFYDGYIASLGQLRIATRKPWGGFAEASYGQLDLLPVPFVETPGNWPPPMSCPTKVSIGTPGTQSVVSFQGDNLIDENGDYITDESGNYVYADDGSLGIIQNPTTIERIVEGTAHLVEPSRDSVKYDIYGPQIETKVTDTKYTGTLQAEFAAACVTLGLAFDYTYARAVSPVVNYKAEGERLLIDNLSAMAEFFSHRFYIENGTLYLVDCLRDNGTVLELTEFDIFPSSYPAPSPIKRITAKVNAEIRDFRLVCLANQGATVCAISEIQIRTKKDGADISGAATVTASSGNSIATNLVDNSNTSNWASTVAPSETLHVQFSYGGTRRPVEIVLRAPALNVERMVTEFKWQGLDLETNTWRTYAEFETEADWEAGEERTFSMTNPTWEVVVPGSHSYGETLDISPVCQTTRALIRPALTNIKTIIERMQIQLVKPLSSVPKIGQKITLLDESMPVPSNIWGRVAELVYDWDAEQCVVKGEGAITAA